MLEENLLVVTIGILRGGRIKPNDVIKHTTIQIEQDF